MKKFFARSERLERARARFHDAALKRALKRRSRHSIPENARGRSLFDILMRHVWFGVLVIPDWMTEIREGLFDGDDIVHIHGGTRQKSSLTRRIHAVVIPGSVKVIGERAFAKCKNLRQVILEEGIEKIEDDAFLRCEKLTEVRLPRTLRHVTGDAFRDCGLKAPVLSGDGKILVCYPRVSPWRTYAVPEGVEEIGSNAFHNAIMLREITFPQSLKRIRTGAFLACAFPRVNVPEGATIEDRSFVGFQYPLEIRRGALLDGMEISRVRGIPFLNRRSIQPPQDEYWLDEEFQTLARRCAAGDVLAMDAMGDYFHLRAEREDVEFFQCAENFWRFRADLHQSARGKETLDRWLAEHPGERMDSPGIDERLCGTVYGRVLNALGFSFFSPGTEYDLCGVDGQGVVCVTVFAGEDGPDEDGFGREEYYDWWYLDKCLNLPKGAHCISQYSSRDKSNHEDSFRAMHDLAAAASSRI